MAYSKTAVDKMIGRDKRIGGREAQRIHALLKGRQSTDEPDGDHGARQQMQVTAGSGGTRNHDFHVHTEGGCKECGK